MVTFSEEEAKVIYSSLLHDIGKFYDYRPGIDHAKNGNNFAKSLGDKLGDKKRKFFEESVGALIGNHHKTERYEGSILSIISIADRITAEQRIEETEKSVRKYTAMSLPTSIFFADNENQNPENKKFFIPKRLSEIIKLIKNSDDPDSIYKNIISTEPNKSWFDEFYSKKNYNNFLSTVVNIFKSLDINSDVAMSYLEMVLMDYLSFIPSDVIRGRDLSLFNHLKNSSALSLALYRSDNKDDVSVIVVNIGGIQEFIFSNLRDEIARKGATKRFRGRSLFVAVVTNIIEEYIRRKLKLPYHNTLVKSSGELIILSHKITNDEFKELKKDILEFEANELQGSLNIRILKIDCKKDELFKYDMFSKFLEKVDESIKYEKYHHFSDHIDIITSLNENIKENEQEICKLCGNISHNKKEGKCKICFISEKLGSKIPKSNFIGIKIKINESINEDNKSHQLHIGDYTFGIYALKESELHKEKNSIFLVKIYKFPEMMNHIKNGNGNFFTAMKNGNVVRILWEDVNTPLKKSDEKEEVRELDEILNLTNYNSQLERIGLSTIKKDASASKAKLSMVYIDIDNLGEILFHSENSMKPDENREEENYEFENVFGRFKRDKNKWTIERFLMISTYINMFFSLINRRLCELYDLYVIFSGGDDSRAIANPIIMLPYLNSFNKNFIEFFDRKFSYSAGFGIFDSKIPLLTLNRKIKTIESYAKHKHKNKSSICFNKKHLTIRINELPTLYENILKLKKILLKQGVSKSLIYKVLKISRSYKTSPYIKEGITKSPKIYLSLSLIKYAINMTKIKNEFRKQIEDILLNEQIIPIFEIISTFVLMENDKLRVV